MTEGHHLDHSKWPCRKKQGNNSGAKNTGDRHNDNSGLHYVGNHRQSDEEFFIIDEIKHSDDVIKFKKLFLLYIKMDDPNGINKAASTVVWTPLAKVCVLTISKIV